MSPESAVSLSRHEVQAGKLFRAACRERLARAGPPDIAVPVWIHHYRHECEARGRLSWTLALTEHYIYSPEYWVCYCSFVAVKSASFPHEDCQGGKVLTPAGFFAFYWKQGQCRRCKVTASSPEGALVLAGTRAPLRGAIVEEFRG